MQLQYILLASCNTCTNHPTWYAFFQPTLQRAILLKYHEQRATAWFNWNLTLIREDNTLLYCKQPRPLLCIIITLFGQAIHPARHKPQTNQRYGNGQLTNAWSKSRAKYLFRGQSPWLIPIRHLFYSSKNHKHFPAIDALPTFGTKDLQRRSDGKPIRRRFITESPWRIKIIRYPCSKYSSPDIVNSSLTAVITYLNYSHGVCWSKLTIKIIQFNYDAPATTVESPNHLRLFFNVLCCRLRSAEAAACSQSATR